MIHQSCPAVLFLLDSHPSIHLPRLVYLSGMKIPRPGFSRFSFLAKKSSLHNNAFPPRRSAARSTRTLNNGSLMADDSSIKLFLFSMVSPQIHGHTPSDPAGRFLQQHRKGPDEDKALVYV